MQLDDNYTTAGSRGGKQLLSVWELIRWFSSFGKEGGRVSGWGWGCVGGDEGRQRRRRRRQGAGGGFSLFGAA